jgi:hypothetical protein
MCGGSIEFTCLRSAVPSAPRLCQTSKAMGILGTALALVVVLVAYVVWMMYLGTREK